MFVENDKQDCESMTGRVCLITGATAGIGKAAALQLARLGASVVMVGRNESRCMATAEYIQRETGNRSVQYFTGDLSSQSQIHDLVKRFEACYDRLHVLVNNVGALFAIRSESVDGVEMTLAVNHLGPFLLTNLLMPTLIKSAPSRIINVSSNAHQDVKSFDFDDPQAKRRKYPRSEVGNFAYSVTLPWAHPGFIQYAQSKLANVLFTLALADRLENTEVTVNAVDPGLVASNITAGNGSYGWFMRMWGRWFGRSPEEGAKTIVHLASSPTVRHTTGKYFVDCQSVTPSKAAQDRTSASRLWQISEELTFRIHHPSL